MKSYIMFKMKEALSSLWLLLCWGLTQAPGSVRQASSHYRLKHSDLGNNMLIDVKTHLLFIQFIIYTDFAYAFL